MAQPIIDLEEPGCNRMDTDKDSDNSGTMQVVVNKVRAGLSSDEAEEKQLPFTFMLLHFCQLNNQSVCY